MQDRACQDILYYIGSQVGRGLELEYELVVHEVRLTGVWLSDDSYDRLETKPMRLQRWFAKKGITLESPMGYIGYSKKYYFWRENL